MLQLRMITGVNPGKSILVASGENFGISKGLEPKVGQYALIAHKGPYNQRTNESGELVECEEFYRDVVTFCGTKEAALQAKTEPTLLAMEEASFILQATTVVKDTYKLSDEQFQKLQAAL